MNAVNKVLEVLEVSEKLLSKLDSDHEKIEKAKLNKLIQTAPLLFMSSESAKLEALKKELAADPQDHNAIEKYETLSERLERPQSNTIQNYLDYYSKVRASKDPFNLDPLDRFVSPEDIRYFIEKNIRSKKLSSLQLEFLFAEMIRRLKLDKKYSLFTWPRTKKSHLHKTNLFKHVFSDLLAKWQTIPALKKAEETMRRLSIFILFHLLKEKGITGFLQQEQNQFVNIVSKSVFYESYDYDDDPDMDRELDLGLAMFPGVLIPLVFYHNHQELVSATLDLQEADLRHVNLERIEFLTNVDCTKADLRRSSFKNVFITSIGIFNFASLAEANLKDIHLDLGGDFICTDLKKTNLEQLKFEKDANYTHFNFHGADFREAKLNKNKFNSPFFLFGINDATGRKTIITQSQYKTYFKKFDRALFQIEEDAPSIEAGPSAILPFDVSL